MEVLALVSELALASVLRWVSELVSASVLRSALELVSVLRSVLELVSALELELGCPAQCPRFLRHCRRAQCVPS